MDWISVDKELPEKDGYYLVVASDIINRWQEVRWLKTHRRKRWIADDGHSDYTPIITHWQTLLDMPND